MTGWLTFGGGNARTGATTSAVGVPRSSWFVPLPGTVTTQPLVARNVPRPGDVTVYVGTADGYVYALAANGYVRWRADLGRQTNGCAQVTDETCERFCVLGTPEQHVEKLQRLQTAGVDQWNIYLMTHGQEETLRVYGEEIIPRFGAQAA